MTTDQLRSLLAVAEKAAEKTRHPDDCNCMAEFKKHFKPFVCAELVRESLAQRTKEEQS